MKKIDYALDKLNTFKIEAFYYCLDPLNGIAHTNFD